jgi:hypothetical protein
MAKVKKSKEMNPENLLIRNMEMEPHKRERITILLGPNRVASVPPINEKRRYPISIPPLRSPICM